MLTVGLVCGLLYVACFVHMVCGLLYDIVPPFFSDRLSKILQPDGGGPEELRVQKAVGLEYVIDVYTSDIKDAGTDAKVFICIYGEDGDTGDQRCVNVDCSSDVTSILTLMPRVAVQVAASLQP
jgi:hypothetical protein